MEGRRDGGTEGGREGGREGEASLTAEHIILNTERQKHAEVVPHGNPLGHCLLESLTLCVELT